MKKAVVANAANLREVLVDINTILILLANQTVKIKADTTIGKFAENTLKRPLPPKVKETVNISVCA